MAMSYQDYIQKTGCQLVADQLISGFPHHKLLGSIADGSFTLTEDGQALLEQLDAPAEAPAKTTRKKKEEAVKASDSVEIESNYAID